MIKTQLPKTSFGAVPLKYELQMNCWENNFEKESRIRVLCFLPCISSCMCALVRDTVTTLYEEGKKAFSLGGITIDPCFSNREKGRPSKVIDKRGFFKCCVEDYVSLSVPVLPHSLSVLFPETFPFSLCLLFYFSCFPYPNYPCSFNTLHRVSCP